MRKLILIFCAMLSSCVTTQMTPLQSNESQIERNFPPIEPTNVKIFLLERDIPLKIERLGVLKITSERSSLRVIEEKLRNECAKIGANGAYRLNEGTIYTNEVAIISYLCFHY